MANIKEVTSRLEQGVTVLTVTYDPARMGDPDAPSELAQEFTDEYNLLEKQATTKSCVVVINSQVAGSPIVRALIELYILVSSK